MTSKKSDIHVASCFVLYLFIFQIVNVSKLTLETILMKSLAFVKQNMNKLTMKNSMGFFCFLFIFLSVASLSLQQLQNNDMVGLMAFKSSSIEKDPKGYLANWSSKSSLSLCLWNGVICSPDNQVTALNFTNAGLTGNLRIDDIKALKNLKHIYFRGNSFSGDLSHSITLPCNFETIDMSSNNFSVPISDVFLSSCDRLISLNLSWNSIPRGSFAFGASLQILDLSHNLLTGELPSNFVAADAESPVSLRFLDLSQNNLSGNFSIFNLGKCNNLTVLNLSHNHLHGTGFSDSLNNCQHLQILDLSNNWLQFHIPRELGNLKSLQKLSLANNGFSGEIPGELNQTCRTLQELDLSRNYLTGGFPLSFISCSSLQTLNLGNNILSVNFLDTVVRNLSSLKHLYVPFNNITGSIPLSLSNSIQLQILDLSSNGFTGNFPSGLCSSSSSLQKILFRSNFLSGTIPAELGNCKNLRILDLSFNNFSGSIPLGIWALPNLSDLVIWANSLSGEIPESICSDGGRNLEKLILNSNFLTGTIPQSLTSCTSLRWVSLASNRLTGKIPTGIGNLNSLAILQLGNNSLTGEIPAELGKCRSLIWIELNNNDFKGYIPQELADQSGLVTKSLSDDVDIAFAPSDDYNCRGIEHQILFEGIRTQRLADFLKTHSCSSSLRIYTGVSFYPFQSHGSVIYLDLSFNFLTGHIPESIGSMTYLQVLNFEHNKLTGTIPMTLGGLQGIGVLDLSDNDLEGFLPDSLGTLSFLSDLDVSNNHLSGSIPSAGQLTTFPSSRYENNSGLCGTPLPPCVSPTKNPPPYLNLPEKKHSIYMDEGFAVSLEVGFIVGFLGFLSVFLLKTSWRYSTFSFMDKMTKKFCLF